MADRGKTQQIEVEVIERVIPEAQILVSHFASESKIETIGEVVETETGSVAAAQDAMVFVKLESAQPGQRYLVVKTLGAVESRAADAKGYVNAVQAQIEIVNQINASEGVYRAKVIRSLALVEVGDAIIAEEIPIAPSSAEPAGGDVLSEVMGGQFNQRREIFGPGQVLFLNAGTEAGVRVGTSLPIFRNPRARNLTSSYLLANPVQIGQIDIVRADTGTATALVRWATDEIRVGDVTSPGQIK